MSTFMNKISNCCYYIRRKIWKRETNTDFDNTIFPDNNYIVYNKYKVN